MEEKKNCGGGDENLINFSLQSRAQFVDFKRPQNPLLLPVPPTQTSHSRVGIEFQFVDTLRGDKSSSSQKGAERFSLEVNTLHIN
jgi:hypothetical protein